MSDPNRAITVTPRLLWAVGSAAGIIAGSVGTWVSVGPFSVGGTTDGGDGIYTLAAGILALVLVIGERSRPAIAAVAGIALAVGVVDASTVLRTDGNEFFSVSLGWGLILLIGSAASLFAWGVTEVRDRHLPRRGIYVTATVVVAVVTLGVLGASGRFDDPNEADAAPVAEAVDEGTSGDGSSDPTSAQEEEVDPFEEPPASEPQSGVLGDSLTLEDDDANPVRIRLVRITDALETGEYDVAGEGARYVGVELVVENQGTSTSEPNPAGNAIVVTDEGREIEPAIVVSGDCSLDGDGLTIRPGEKRRACVPFELKDGVTVASFQTSAAAYEGELGVWTVP